MTHLQMLPAMLPTLRQRFSAFIFSCLLQSGTAPWESSHLTQLLY